MNALFQNIYFARKHIVNNDRFNNLWNPFRKFQYHLRILCVRHINRYMRLSDRYPTRIVRDARHKDKIAGRMYRTPDFVTPEWVESQQNIQGNKCFWCLKFMDWIKRNKADGLTCERLDNSLPHTTANCVLACHRCNSKKLTALQGFIRRLFAQWREFSNKPVNAFRDDQRRPRFT